MVRSSENLSATLEHDDAEDGGDKGGSGGSSMGDDTGSGIDTKKESPSLVEEQRPAPRRGMFGSLRGRGRAAAAMLRGEARKGGGGAGSKGKGVLKIVKRESDDKVGGKIEDKIGEKVMIGSDDRIGDGVQGKISEGDYLVHPAHGVGYVRGVEAEEVSGARMDMIAISFEQERMIVRVPTCEYENCGLRSVSSPEEMEGIYDTLKTKRRIRKTMWGRRAQEYDSKIRSGDPVRLAQVVRELYRGEEQPIPSYSERQYYQLALERLSREVAVVEKIEEQMAVEKLETILAAA